MSSRSSSTLFSELYKKSSKDLYSEKFYDAMDMESDDLQNYEKKCNEIFVREAKDQMILICKKYLRFLDTSKTWSGQFTKFDVSLLLNYWLYEKLIGIYGDRNSKYITFGFSDLQLIWGYFDYKPDDESYYKKCKPDPSNVNHEDWENRKKLYDYYVDYDYLNMMANFHDNKCEYYKKIQDKKSLYEYFEEECSPEKNNCPDFYKECESYNPKYVLPNLHCHAEMQAAARALDQSPGIRDDAAQRLGHEAGGGRSQFQEAAESTQDTHPTSQSSDIGTKVSHSVLGAAPVLLTATMLYRYTPLGPWIRNLGGGRTNSMGAMNTFSPYTEETGNIFSEDSSNFISYQPI
ncbi:Plasmodium vivax Vir protein, putative [Plasmodium vivax]|nr:Plasmodium vivax Vir protein, putative [Plasmodium vivax]